MSFNHGHQHIIMICSEDIIEHRIVVEEYTISTKMYNSLADIPPYISDDKLTQNIAIYIEVDELEWKSSYLSQLGVIDILYIRGDNHNVISNFESLSCIVKRIEIDNVDISCIPNSLFSNGIIDMHIRDTKIVQLNIPVNDTLKWLSIPNCHIISIDTVENLNGLRLLDISNNRVKDLSPLARFKNDNKLSLNIAYNPIEDYTLLNNIRHLTGVCVGSNIICEQLTSRNNPLRRSIIDITQLSSLS